MSTKCGAGGWHSHWRSTSKFMLRQSACVGPKSPGQKGHILYGNQSIQMIYLKMMMTHIRRTNTSISKMRQYVRRGVMWYFCPTQKTYSTASYIDARFCTFCLYSECIFRHWNRIHISNLSSSMHDNNWKFTFNIIWRKSYVFVVCIRLFVDAVRVTLDHTKNTRSDLNIQALPESIDFFFFRKQICLAGLQMMIYILPRQLIIMHKQNTEQLSLIQLIDNCSENHPKPHDTHML